LTVWVIKYDRPTICTVELSKKLIRTKASYSLGKLVRSLEFPCTDRHRASGDLCIKLFKLLLSKVYQEIVKAISKQKLKPGMAQNF
jgi:DNA polymerase-3 subunit epsilon